MYNIPALLVLALLVWKRPYIGAFMAVLAFFRVGWPILGGVGQPVPFSVHGALVFTTMFAWVRDDWRGNAVLFLAGVSLFLIVKAAVGTLIVESASFDVGMGLVIGAIIALVRALFWSGVALIQAVQKKDPTSKRG